MDHALTKRWLLVAGLAPFLALAPARPATGEEPPRAPACELHPLTASAPTRIDRLLGKVVYVDFWASWCVPCAATFPFLNALQRDLGPHGLQVVGISVDEQPAAAQGFLAEHPAEFAVASDASGDCQQAYGVDVLTTSYLIDRQGRVRYVHRGFQPPEAGEVRRQVELLLAEPAAPVAVPTAAVATPTAGRAK